MANTNVECYRLGFNMTFCKIHLHPEGERGYSQLLKPTGLRNPQFCLRLCQNPSRLTPAPQDGSYLLYSHRLRLLTEPLTQLLMDQATSAPLICPGIAKPGSNKTTAKKYQKKGVPFFFLSTQQVCLISTFKEEKICFHQNIIKEETGGTTEKNLQDSVL